MFKESTIAVSISRIHFPVTTLGPGNRIGIWFQGCGIRCWGCVFEGYWAGTPANTTIAEVLSICTGFKKHTNGVTITGGEPFGTTQCAPRVTDRVTTDPQSGIGYPTLFRTCHGGRHSEALVMARTGRRGDP